MSIKAIGKVGEDARMAQQRSEPEPVPAFDLNRLPKYAAGGNAPACDLVTRDGFESVKTYSDAKKAMNHLLEIQADESWESSRQRGAASTLAKAVSDNREAIQREGAWPDKLAPDASESEIRELQRSAKLALPEDIAEQARAAIEGIVRENPSLCGIELDRGGACGFAAPRVSRDSRFAVARRHVAGGNPAVGTWNKELEFYVAWQPSPDGVTVMVAVYDASLAEARLPEIRIQEDVVNTLTRLVRPQEASAPLETVLAPGEPLTAAPRGPVRDYSHCAQENELSALFSGDLPLGRYAFGRTPDQVKHGRPLFLSRFGKIGQPMIYNGVLVCAPQNSGKTELLLRWAAAANAAGHSILIIDVKGNMRDKLARNGAKWRGEMFCFSTRPESHSDRIDFLAPLARSQRLDSRRLETLAGALLPAEGWDGEGGEAEMFYQGRLLRLTALLHILKFRTSTTRRSSPPGSRMRSSTTRTSG